MKLLGVSSLILLSVMAATPAQAGINAGTSGGLLNSQEKCASALNGYLSYRHKADSADMYKIQKLENQVDSFCEGYQVQLVENNGVMTGVIELAE